MIRKLERPIVVKRFERNALHAIKYARLNPILTSPLNLKDHILQVPHLFFFYTHTSYHTALYTLDVGQFDTSV